MPEVDLALMKLIDRIHKAKPLPGSTRIVDALEEQGLKEGLKRMWRSM